MRKFLVLSCSLLLAGCNSRERDAKRRVAEVALDPAAVQFRNVHMRGSWVCGEYNGKNRYGAYVGYQWFVVFDSIPIMDEATETLRTAEGLCSGK